MKVVAFNGSPRVGGNTEFLLKEVLKEIGANGIESQLIQVGNKNIRGCLACYKCFENKNLKCVMDKDIFNACMDKMVQADAPG